MGRGEESSTLMQAEGLDDTSPSPGRLLYLGGSGGRWTEGEGTHNNVGGLAGSRSGRAEWT